MIDTNLEESNRDSEWTSCIIFSSSIYGEFCRVEWSINKLNKLNISSNGYNSQLYIALMLKIFYWILCNNKTQTWKMTCLKSNDSRPMIFRFSGDMEKIQCACNFSVILLMGKNNFDIIIPVVIHNNVNESCILT